MCQPSAPSFSAVHLAKVRGRMPIYCFSLDVNVPPRVVAERLKSIVREKARLSESMAWPSYDRASPPFIGTVQDDSFRIRRDIRSRNSFLPLIWGRVVPIGIGARVSVTMFIHPLVALFVMLWLGMAANFAVTLPSPFVPLGMFIFGVALTIGGFFPEAMKAKRLISEAVYVRLY
jgi:hypothetical protein